ncbi:MAG: hypothetical protein ACO22T_10200, partial [Burkholderiales bacterium]
MPLISSNASHRKIEFINMSAVQIKKAGPEPCLLQAEKNYFLSAFFSSFLASAFGASFLASAFGA